MAYLGTENFVGSKVDGYQANKCYLQQNAALVQVQQAAEAKGYTLWIFDCYRPQRAVNHFMRWASDLSDTRTKAQYYPNLGKDKLVGEYIAEKSGHSRGSQRSTRSRAAAQPALRSMICNCSRPIWNGRSTRTGSTSCSSGC